MIDRTRARWLYLFICVKSILVQCELVLRDCEGEPATLHGWNGTKEGTRELFRVDDRNDKEVAHERRTMAVEHRRNAKAMDGLVGWVESRLASGWDPSTGLYTFISCLLQVGIWVIFVQCSVYKVWIAPHPVESCIFYLQVHIIYIIYSFDKCQRSEAGIFEWECSNLAVQWCLVNE